MHVTKENFKPFLSALLRGTIVFEDENLTVAWDKFNDKVEELAEKLERMNLTNEEVNERNEKTFNEIQVAISGIRSNLHSKKTIDEVEFDTKLYDRLLYVNSGLQQMYKRRDIEEKKYKKEMERLSSMMAEARYEADSETDALVRDELDKSIAEYDQDLKLQEKRWHDKRNSMDVKIHDLEKEREHLTKEREHLTKDREHREQMKNSRPGRTLVRQSTAAESPSRRDKSVDHLERTINSLTQQGIYRADRFGDMRQNLHDITPIQGKLSETQTRLQESKSNMTDGPVVRPRVVEPGGINPINPPASAAKKVRKMDLLDEWRLEKFSGEFWGGFIDQFEEKAKYEKWNDEEKVIVFSRLLRGPALEFWSELPKDLRGQFQWVKERFEQHFVNKDPPLVNMLALFHATQYEDESIEQYYTRVERMLQQSFPGETSKVLNAVGMDKFITGCKDKQAAITVLDAKPKTMREAYELLRQALATRQVLFGKKNERHMVRSVSFSRDDENGKFKDEMRTEMDRFKNKIEGEVKLIREDVSEIKNLLRTLNLNNINNSNNKSPQRKLACYKCGKEGHFQRECHLRSPAKSNLKGPSPSRSDLANWRDHGSPRKDSGGYTSSPPIQRQAAIVEVKGSENTENPLNSKGGD
jgi:hypothetical protein